MSACEWPARAGAAAKCGRPAKGRAYSDPDDLTKWSRAVCGIHARRARAIGWRVEEASAKAAVPPADRMTDTREDPNR